MYKKKLSICFATEDFYPSFIGGQGVYGYHVTEELAKQGVKVLVLAENRAGRGYFWRNKKVKVVLVPFVGGNQLLLALLEYFYFIFRYRNSWFDIVHVNQLSGLFFVWFRPKNIGRIIVSVHNTWEQMENHAPSLFKKILYRPLILLESYVFQHADGLLFHTKSEEAYAVSTYALAGKQRAVVSLGTPSVKYTIRQKEIARREVRQRLGIPSTEHIVLYIGRLARRKNVETLLLALRILNRAHGSVYGIVVGDGNDRRRLETFAPTNVRFLGYVPDARPYLLAADMFVLPSVAEGGVALSALEAAAYGLPLLLSSDASDKTILEDGKNGYTIDPYDSPALANKIMECLDSPSFGKQSKRKVAFLTWDRCTEGTLTFYRSLLETPFDRL